MLDRHATGTLHDRQDVRCAASGCEALAGVPAWPLNPALPLCARHGAPASRRGWRLRVDLRCKADPLEPDVMQELVRSLGVQWDDLADAVIRRGLNLESIEGDLRLRRGAVDAAMRASPKHGDAWRAVRGEA